MKQNQPNTDDITDVDLTKYTKVLRKTGNTWVENGYECKACLSRLKRIGKVLSHAAICRGKPLNPSQRGY